MFVHKRGDVWCEIDRIRTSPATLFYEKQANWEFLEARKMGKNMVESGRERKQQSWRYHEEETPTEKSSAKKAIQTTSLENAVIVSGM